MAEPRGQGLLVIERILRDRDGIWRQIAEERGLRKLTSQMLASSAVSLACYGAVLGASNGPAQALSSAIKLPLLFLATLTICLPTLYLFNLVFGARLSVMQAVTLILVSVTVTAVLTLAFAPISLFFLISAHSYGFFKLLNVSILLLTAIVGLRFLTYGMRKLNDHQIQVALAAAPPPPPPPPPALPVPAAPPQPALVAAPAVPAVPATEGNGAMVVAVPQPQPQPLQPQPLQPYPQQPQRQPVPAQVALPAGQRPTSMSLLYIWILLFGFVGTQLAWTLRPFFGSPGEPFQIFRHISGTFYADILHTIGRLLSGG
jgi:hypothetical protein